MRQLAASPDFISVYVINPLLYFYSRIFVDCLCCQKEAFDINTKTWSEIPFIDVPRGNGEEGKQVVRRCPLRWQGMRANSVGNGGNERVKLIPNLLVIFAENQ